MQRETKHAEVTLVLVHGKRWAVCAAHTVDIDQIVSVRIVEVLRNQLDRGLWRQGGIKEIVQAEMRLPMEALLQWRSDARLA